MKKKSCLTLALILVMMQVISLFAVLPATAASTSTKNYNFIKIPETTVMNIDGSGAEGVWGNAGWSEKFAEVHPGYDNGTTARGQTTDVEVLSNLSMRFKAVWQRVGADKMKIYVLVATGTTTAGRSESWANGFRIRIESTDGSNQFSTYYKALRDIDADAGNDYTTTGVKGDFDGNYQLKGLNDIPNSGVAMYEFSYEMDYVESFKFDILPAICTSDGKWYCASWAGATLEANKDNNFDTGANGATGIATISNSEIDSSLPSINVVKATQAVTIDGAVDDAWVNAGWSNQFERHSATYERDYPTNDPKHVFMKAMWYPAAEDKVNVYLLVVAPTTTAWGNGNFIQVQVANSKGCFYTPRMKKGAMDATTGTAIGLTNTSFQMACADNTIGGSNVTYYEFSYQMNTADIVDGIRLDAVVRGEPAGGKYTNYCWAGATTLLHHDIATTTVLSTPSGIGKILDETYAQQSTDIIKTTKNIVVDGIADEGVWEYAGWSSSFVSVSRDTINGFDAKFKAVWSPVEKENEADEDMMDVYILIQGTGLVYQWGWRNNIRIQIEDENGNRFWTGQKQLQNITSDKVNANNALTGAATTDSGLSTSLYMNGVNNIGQDGSATYEFCYRMKKTDVIKLDILLGTRKSEAEDVDCLYSWATTFTANGTDATIGIGNIVDTPTDELLADLQAFVDDEETRGASVYVDSGRPEYAGIRFATTINMDAFNALMAQGATITTGTLVTYTETLELLEIADADFNLETLTSNENLEEGVHYYNIVNTGNGWVNEKPGTWFATIYDIQDYDRQFSAVGYITIEFGGQTITACEVYDTATDARSIAYVAEKVMEMENTNGHIGLDDLNQERGMFTVAQEAILESFYKTEAEQ